jgi:ribonuclease HI
MTGTMRISMKDGGITCYCDGACVGNPGPGGWGAIVRTPDGEVRELGAAESETTNNRMELAGAIHALELVRGRQAERVSVYTDSTYVVHGIESWVWGWRRRGWVRADGHAVANRDLWERLVALVEARRATGPVTFHHVAGHAGIPGNERCDRISVAFARGDRPGLYRGPATLYRIDLTPPPPAPPPSGRRSRSGAAPRAPASHPGAATYLSLVDGRLERHDSWEECQRRVEGRSGARHKKCRSADEERQTLAAWGHADSDGAGR